VTFQQQYGKKLTSLQMLHEFHLADDAVTGCIPFLTGFSLSRAATLLCQHIFRRSFLTKFLPAAHNVTSFLQAL